MEPEERDDLYTLRVLITVAVPLIALFGLVCFFLWGCAPTTQSWQPTCTDYALLEASVARGQGYDVRIVTGRSKEGSLHATGQYRDESGVWLDLRYWPQDGRVYTSGTCCEVVEGPIHGYTVGRYAEKRRRFAVDLKGE